MSIRTKNPNSVNFYSIVATIVNVLLPGSADSKITVEITGKLKEVDRLAAALQTANDPTRIRFRSAGTVQNDVRIQSVETDSGLEHNGIVNLTLIHKCVDSVCGRACLLVTKM